LEKNAGATLELSQNVLPLLKDFNAKVAAGNAAGANDDLQTLRQKLPRLDAAQKGEVLRQLEAKSPDVLRLAYLAKAQAEAVVDLATELDKALPERRPELALARAVGSLRQKDYAAFLADYDRAEPSAGKALADLRQALLRGVEQAGNDEEGPPDKDLLLLL